MLEKIKYESSLVKKWFAQTESNEDINNPGVIDIVLELMHHFDIKSNKRDFRANTKRYFEKS